MGIYATDDYRTLVAQMFMVDVFNKVPVFSATWQHACWS